MASETSIDSFKQSQAFIETLCDRILELARKAGACGLTIHEAEQQLGDHRARGVSARFAELVRTGKLSRVITGYCAPTARYPQGMPRYATRYDQETQRNVIVHWIPEFAPQADYLASDDDPNMSTKRATSVNLPELAETQK